MEDIQKDVKGVSRRNKSTIILIMLLIITLSAASGFAMFAWAKYSSKENGTAQAPVAGWWFELKDGIATTEDKIDFPVTRTDGKFDVVAEGTIAPGTWGEIPITVITTGTEVHMKYDINITIENCPTNLKFYKDAKHKKEFTTTRTEPQNGEEAKTATITIEKYVDKDDHKEHGEHQHIIYWYWPFETGKGSQIDNNDLVDSEDMHLGTATMAITATGMQVLELQDDPDNVPDTIYALFEKSTGTLKLSHNPFVDYAAEDKYYTGVENFVSSSPMWYSHRSNILNVEVVDEIRPKSTYRWFSGCNKLTSVDLHNLNAENVTNISSMFSSCSSLTSLDVSGFDTGNVTDMSSMLNSCKNLMTVYASGSFNTNKVTSSSNMFRNCTKLKGGNGTIYNSSRIDKTYARIDTAETPGYFTEKTN